jgi:transposase
MTQRSTSPKSLARILSIDYTSVLRIYNKFVNTGEPTTPRRGGNKEKKLSEMQLGCLKRWVLDENVLTLAQLKRKISLEFNIDVSERTIATYLEGFYFSFKRISVISEVSLSEELFEQRKVYSREFLRLKN